MKTVGIIAEYNPFHNGHLYHLEQAKKITGAKAAVVIMSGDFVQRGAPSITDKYTRTRMALKSGADLVFELPVRYALGSAEYFARGAVAMLNNLGIIDFLCFGSEWEDLSVLNSIANLMLEEPPLFKRVLNYHLKKGHSFPFARMEAVLSCMSNINREVLEQILSSPNTILGLEYLKALKQSRSTIKAFTIKRVECGYHDKELKQENSQLSDMAAVISSATSIRLSYQSESSLDTLRKCIPRTAFSVLEQAENKTFPVTENDLSPYLFYKLLTLSGKDLTDYLDVSNDLSARIQNTASAFSTFHNYADQLKTKQYTKTRINRCLLHILLEIKSFTMKGKDDKMLIPYLRLLGMKKNSTFLLKSSSFSPLVPVITKTAAAKAKLDKEGFSMFQEDLSAASLYNYCIFQKFHTTLENDYKTSPILL